VYLIKQFLEVPNWEEPNKFVYLLIPFNEWNLAVDEIVWIYIFIKELNEDKAWDKKFTKIVPTIEQSGI
jgi:hypothetical protein